MNEKDLIYWFPKLGLLGQKEKQQEKETFTNCYTHDAFFIFPWLRHQNCKAQDNENSCHSLWPFLLDLILNTCTIKISQELKIRMAFDTGNAFPHFTEKDLGCPWHTEL